MIYTLEEIKSRVMPVIEKYNIITSPPCTCLVPAQGGEATEASDLDFLVDTTGTRLTSLLSLGELYCDLEEIFQKEIDLITVYSVNHNIITQSDRDFRDAVIRERVKLNDVA